MSDLLIQVPMHAQICAWAEAFPGVQSDAPFPDDAQNIVLRHIANRKWFALLFVREGAAYVNLKCKPDKAEFWRGVYPSVTPGWHMNKTHWNAIALDGSVPEADLQEMLWDSYTLTAPPTPRKKTR